MLNALIFLSAVMVSEAGSWDPAPFNTIPTHASNPLFTPEEPTTLVLAIIGLGVIGASVGTMKLLRPRRGAAQVSPPRATSKRAA